MINKNLAAVVIPVYKSFERLNEQELMSLKSTCNHLHEFTHVFVGPKSFEWHGYLSFFDSHQVPVTKIEFANCYFRNIEGYNRLLKSLQFYKKLSNYEYILIFQLDAYILKNELDLWCDKGYHYIGAPWNGTHCYNNIPVTGVGNGGFSLRNVKGAIKLLKKLRMLEALQQYKNLNWKGIVPRLPSIIRNLYQAKKSPSNFEKSYNYQEDFFWSKAAPLRLNNFSCNSAILQLMATIFLNYTFEIAPVEDAVKFSFETNPRELFKMNNEQLPFGCHAWEKYDPEFWKEFIPASVK